MTVGMHHATTTLSYLSQSGCSYCCQCLSWLCRHNGYCCNCFCHCCHYYHHSFYFYLLCFVMETLFSSFFGSLFAFCFFIAPFDVGVVVVVIIFSCLGFSSCSSSASSMSWWGFWLTVSRSTSTSLFVYNNNLLFDHLLLDSSMHSHYVSCLFTTMRAKCFIECFSAKIQQKKNCDFWKVFFNLSIIKGPIFQFSSSNCFFYLFDAWCRNRFMHSLASLALKHPFKWLLDVTPLNEF